MSPTERTHKWLREHGYMLTKCEFWHHFARRKIDVWGFIDTWAINEERDVLIQSTTGDNHAARVHKILNNENVAALLRRHDVEVWSWSRRGPRGRRKLWSLRITAFSLHDGDKVVALD
jgi:hypothetical protein